MGQIHLCLPKRYKNGDAVVLRACNPVAEVEPCASSRAKPDRNFLLRFPDKSFNMLPSKHTDNPTVRETNNE